MNYFDDTEIQDSIESDNQFIKMCLALTYLIDPDEMEIDEG